MACGAQVIFPFCRSILMTSQINLAAIYSSQFFVTTDLAYISKIIDMLREFCYYLCRIVSCIFHDSFEFIQFHIRIIDLFDYRIDVEYAPIYAPEIFVSSLLK